MNVVCVSTSHLLQEVTLPPTDGWELPSPAWLKEAGRSSAVVNRWSPPRLNHDELTINAGNGDVFV